MHYKGFVIYQQFRRLLFQAQSIEHEVMGNKTIMIALNMVLSIPTKQLYISMKDLNQAVFKPN